MILNVFLQQKMERVILHAFRGGEGPLRYETYYNKNCTVFLVLSLLEYQYEAHFKTF